MNAICLVFSFIFATCSILFLIGKGYLFIPHWETLTDEEKRDIPLKELSLNMGVVILACAILLFISGVSLYFRTHFFSLSMVLWLVGCGVDIYIIEKKWRITK